MNLLFAICFAVLSVWDYPSRHLEHTQLRNQFMKAQNSGDLEERVAICRKGVALLPDDPIWQYNLACSLALRGSPTGALDALEKAIDLGFRDAEAIKTDGDFVKIAGINRFKDLVEEAKKSVNRPILLGPHAIVPAVGIAGEPLTLGEQNLIWDLDSGCFEAKINLLPSGKDFDGFLYMNRDGKHSLLTVTNYPGLTSVWLDSEGRSRGFDLDYPNIKFPLPLFGNCSRGLVKGPYWRSLPRALMTKEMRYLLSQNQFYLSNQVWVIPAVYDYDFVSTNAYGDVFTSMAPYWVITQGRSWSDQYYLRSALIATQAMKPNVRKEIVAKKLLAPTIQYLFRRSLKAVKTDEDYLTSSAHPTAFPPNGLDIPRLKKLASQLTVESIPPVAYISGVRMQSVLEMSKVPEVTYMTPCAWSFILRSPDVKRSFIIQASGGFEYAFVPVHDERNASSVKKLTFDTSRITIDKEKMTWTNRVDLAIFARTKTSSWGAPSFVSFAILDKDAPYRDPFLDIKEKVSTP